MNYAITGLRGLTSETRRLSDDDLGLIACNLPRRASDGSGMCNSDGLAIKLFGPARSVNLAGCTQHLYGGRLVADFDLRTSHCVSLSTRYHSDSRCDAP